MADESVAWLVQYSSIPNFVKDIKVFDHDVDMVDTIMVVRGFEWTILRGLVAGNLRSGTFHRDGLVEDWLPFRLDVQAFG